MKLCLPAAATVLLLAACSPAPGDAVNVAAKRLPLVDCAGTKVEDKGEEGILHPDCRALFPDASGLAYEARYTAAEDDSIKLTLDIVQTGDAVKQTIEERLGNTLDAVVVKDLDGDGKPDIWAPLETTDDVTTWAIWKQMPDGKFERIGEPQGDVAMTSAGLVTAKQVDAEGAVSVDFYKLDGGDLRLLLTADAEAGPKGPVCTITPGDHFTTMGMTPDAAKKQFCADPVVALAPAAAPAAPLVKDSGSAR